MDGPDRMLRRLQLKGYRSLYGLDLRMGPVTAVTGSNGVGKFNLYHALRLLSALADGRFAEALAKEGGMPSALWAGATREKQKRREIRVKIDHDDFEYEIGYGLIPAAPGNPTAFKTDPCSKKLSRRPFRIAV